MTSEAGKSLFRAANVWWRCVQYFVIASCGIAYLYIRTGSLVAGVV